MTRVTEDFRRKEFLRAGAVARRSPCKSTRAALHCRRITFLKKRPGTSPRGAGALMTKSDDLISGTLDLLILRVIALQPMHGWAIAQRIQQVSREILQVRQGSLYPALHRLELKGL